MSERKRFRSAFRCLLAVSLVLVPAAAHADAPVVEDANAAPEEARAHYLEGNKALAREDWRTAEAEFRKAWEMSRSYDVAANLGQALYKLGRVREAAELFAYSLRSAPPSTKPEVRSHTTELLNIAKKQVTAVRVHVSVQGAEIVVDGEARDAHIVTDEIFVEPGTRSLEARAPGYEGKKMTIEAKADDSVEVTLPLVAVAPAQASKVPVFVLGGAALVGLGVGIGTAVASHDKAVAADAQLATIRATAGPCDKVNPSAACTTLHGLRAEQGTFANTAVWSFVGAGAAGTGALAYWLVTRSSGGAKSTVVTPTVSAGFGGVEVRGTW